MKVKNISYLLFILLIYSCSAPTQKESQSVKSNEWELQILDSIEVNYLANIQVGTFTNGIGVIQNIEGNTLVRFDSTGKILAKKTFPQEGPGTVQWLETILEVDGDYYGSTSFKDIYHFDEELNLLESLKMPFIGEARGGAYNRKNVAAWRDQLLFWYPGRNGISPYKDHFYRDYPLLELYDFATNTSKAVVRTPPTSQYSTDDFFNRPYLNFAIENDSLYLTFSNEAKVHIYAMGDSIQWVRSLDFSPTDFKLIPGQKSEVTYSQSMQMNEASIHGIYSDPNHLIIAYQGGIDGDTFVNNNLKERSNFYRYPEFRKDYIKIYQYGSGWSNEIIIPSKVKLILNIEDAGKPFYGLRNDDYIGEEQEYLTFYKLQLVQK